MPEVDLEQPEPNADALEGQAAPGPGVPAVTPSALEPGKGVKKGKGKDKGPLPEQPKPKQAPLPGLGSEKSSGKDVMKDISEGFADMVKSGQAHMEQLKNAIVGTITGKGETKEAEEESMSLMTPPSTDTGTAALLSLSEKSVAILTENGAALASSLVNQANEEQENQNKPKPK